ncbi:MAG: rod shape-determining protein MreC, partial [Gemmatimonadota bacterium]
MEYYDGTRRSRRRDAVLAGAMVLLALVLYFMPADYQAPIRQALRGTALRPFLALQAEVVRRGTSREDLTEIRAERDSLAAVVAAQATLVEENRRLRGLLGLQQRADAAFAPAEVLRVGMDGAESTFLLTVGTADGVRVGSPVLSAEGLLGVVRDVDERTAHAMDWT